MGRGEGKSGSGAEGGGGSGRGGKAGREGRAGGFCRIERQRWDMLQYRRLRQGSDKPPLLDFSLTLTSRTLSHSVSQGDRQKPQIISDVGKKAWLTPAQPGTIGEMSG
jgi:hypothetical protein